MAAARPLVSIQRSGQKSDPQVALPSVLLAPIRPDVVNFVFTNMNKNKRQAYAVSEAAGHQTSAESWGTGRAVARIPRVAGGGTHRAGQGAFGNMCRAGRMFAPTKIWRKWHKKTNTNQRRYAVASALAASAVPSLVMARGHRVANIPEVPLVVSNAAFEKVNKTKLAVAFLKDIGAFADIEKVKRTTKVRAGKGKWRNRRHVQRRGPLLVYSQGKSLPRAFRNIPGVEVACVSRLNLLQLAPGGHVGRFIIWTEDAFKQLEPLFGTYAKKSTVKKGYSLPRACMTNSDLSRIINSDEIQTRARPKQTKPRKAPRKKNPLTNLGVMVKLNPYATRTRRQALIAQTRAASGRKEAVDKKRAEAAKKQKKAIRAQRKDFYATLENPVPVHVKAEKKAED